MPGTNNRKHVIPLGSEASFTRATIFEQFGESIHDVIPVANTTARSQLVSDLNADGKGPSASNPLVVYRADAPGLHRIESTVDGTVWAPASGILNFGDVAARNSWTTSNVALLTAGDRCQVGANDYRWSGAEWRAVGAVATYTFAAGGAPDAAIISGTVAMSPAAAETTDSSFITATSGLSVTVQKGIYVVTVFLAVNATTTGRTFVSLKKGSATIARNNAATGDDSVSTTVTVMVQTDGTVIAGELFKTTGGTANLTGRLTLTKVA